MSDAVIFPTRDLLLANRRILLRDGGSFLEDSYDFGVWWRDESGHTYRLTWIGPVGRDDQSAEPGELYLQRLAGGEQGWPAELLCIIPPVGTGLTPAAAPNENVEGILDGWADVCGQENSVEWIRDRVREALEAGWAKRAYIAGCQP